MTSPKAVLPWQPGDVILSADRRLFIRSGDGSTGGGRWPWHEGVEYVPAGGPGGPEGGTPDEDVRRPVTLLIRAGRPLGGVVTDDRMIQGEVVRGGVLPA